MRYRPSVCSIGIFLAYEYLVGADLEYYFGSIYSVNRRDCGAWFNLDYAAPKP